MKSAYQKLERAKQHLALLDASITAFRALDAYEFVPKEGEPPQDKRLAVIEYHVKVKSELPDSWGVIVGDILTNLRAALDHSVFGHAADRNALSPKHVKAMSFPILTDPVKGFAGPTKTLGALVDPTVLAVVESRQPYNVSDPATARLQVLNELVNVDKHRTINVIAYSAMELGIKRKADDIIIRSVDLHPVEMVDGAVIGSVILDRPIGQSTDKAPTYRTLDGTLEVGYVETIAIPSVDGRHSVLDVMEALVFDVEDVLHELKKAGC
ncbi:hypothetical protein [Rhodococcus sp. IEGM 1406]|uniref:hypothetical protein n=1 Tax=Rhodococcus sp. IEGM 1406 TaxID=3047083 RepID=UPI0024B6FEC4|nr:hypothetical protein [Rhodococcus sp. IEGM 1406]MDI9907988.1 hypothetical protein [Rhodococcus sp. IEGM 1406]